VFASTQNVNANLRDGSGIPITSTLVNGTTAININNADSLRSQAVVNACFYTTTDKVTIAPATEAPLFLFINSSTSNVRAYINTVDENSLTNNTLAIFRIYRNPTVTANGTAMTIVPCMSSAPSNSKMQAFRVPTVSANGQINWIDSVKNNPTTLKFNQARILAPGSTTLITVINGVVNQDVAVNLEWSEEP